LFSLDFLASISGRRYEPSDAFPIFPHAFSRALIRAMAERGKWVRTLRISLRVCVVLALILVGLEYYRRWMRIPLRRQEPERIQRVDDFYVHPPKSYVTDLDSAQKLVGQPLWVIEGYRWRTQPGGRLLEPLEKIVPVKITRRGEEALVSFEREGKVESVAVGAPSRLYIDDIFFIKDPKELYKHWPVEIWSKVEGHQIEPGMTEFQVAFALGAGQTVRSSPGGITRIVEYTLCAAAGLQPVRVTFQNGRAESIEPLPARGASG
jgi:hypothetical protein